MNEMQQLMNEMQQLFFLERQVCFQEKSDHSQLLALSVHKIFDLMTFSRNVYNERCFADRNLLIEILLAEIDRVAVQ